MSAVTARILAGVWHPFLLSAYLVLHMFSLNFGEVEFGDVTRALIVMPAVTLAVWLGFRLISRDWRIAGFLTSLSLALFFTLGAVEDFALRFGVSNISLILAVEALAYFAVVVLTLRNVTDWARLNRILNGVAAALLVVTLIRIIGFAAGVGQAPGARDAGGEIARAEPVFQPVGGVRPDIYYVVLDAYTRTDTLREYFGYDNSDFVEFLRDRGFRVAERSAANHNLTGLAVSTVLNFDYISEHQEIREPRATAVPYLMRTIYVNKAASILRDMGYRVVTIKSVGDYVATEGALNIDGDVEWWRSNEFEFALLDATILTRVLRRLNKDSFSNRQRIDNAIEQLALQANEPGPKLVLAHIYAPHQPFIYGRDGSNPGISARHFGETEFLGVHMRAYADQIHYLNELLRDMVERILSNSAIPPIIVLQGDHGLRISFWEEPAFENFCLKEMYSTLNAFYLPGDTGAELFYDTISPVNTFRLIFDTYFSSDLGFLDDRAYYTKRVGQMDFVDITENVEGCSPAWQQKLEMSGHAEE